MGVRESFAFQPVCESEEHSQALLELLEGATAAQGAAAITVAEEDRLEAIHYRVWMSRRGEHIESVTQSAEIRMAWSVCTAAYSSDARMSFSSREG